MILLKCFTQYVSKLVKLSIDHKTGKCQFALHSQRKAMPKNVLTTIQLSSFCMLSRSSSNSPKLGFSSTRTEKFQIYKLGFEEAEEPEIKLLTVAGSWMKQRRSGKTSASLTMLTHLTLWITMNCGIFLKRREYQTTLLVSLGTYLQVKKQQLEPDMEKLTGLGGNFPKLGKEYDKATVYCQPAYLAYM